MLRENPIIKAIMKKDKSTVYSQWQWERAKKLDFLTIMNLIDVNRNNVDFLNTVYKVKKQEETILTWALKERAIEIVRYLLRLKYNKKLSQLAIPDDGLQARDSQNASFLECVLHEHTSDFIEFAAMPCFNINVTDHKHKPLIFHAILKDNAELVNAFLSREDFKLSACTDSKHNVLTLAAQQNMLHAMEALLACKLFDINMRDRDQHKTPLEIAVINKHQAMAILLLRNCKDNDVDILAEDSNGDSLFRIACKNGLDEVVDYLLTSYIFPDNHRQVINALEDGLIHLKSSTIRRFVDFNLNTWVNVLYYAYERNLPDLVDQIIAQANFHPYSRFTDANNHTYNYITYGIKKVPNSESLLRKLIEKLAKLQSHKSDHMHTFFCSARRHNSLVFNELIAKFRLGIDDADNHGKRALHHAVIDSSGERDFIVNMIDKQNADVNVRDEAGDTPLHTAVTNKELTAVKTLCRYQRTDVNAVNNAGQTPLMLALQAKNRSCTDILLERKDLLLNVIDQFGKPAIIYAFETGSFDYIKLIVEKDRNVVNHVDATGNTILHYIAMTENNVEHIEYLLNHGALATLFNGDGYNVYNVARNHGHHCIADYLLQLMPAFGAPVAPAAATVLPSAPSAAEVGVVDNEISALPNPAAFFQPPNFNADTNNQASKPALRE